ncbi:MAG: GntR family transcriptional regulator [Oscillospiraceae bacterium]|nr:GntR family transcriptional regulator [Oscillospiraceae bacterium]
MHWVFTPDTPIYLQVVSQLEQMIASGLLSPGDKLSSVREFAAQANVNPNTMQKALTELENRGIVYSRRTSGRFITDDPQRIAKLREELADKVVSDFLSAMNRLGYSESEAAGFISDKLLSSSKKGK